MVLFSSILAMFSVYYGYDSGLVIGFMVALFLEILYLIFLYNLLKRSEEQVNLRLIPLIDEQRHTVTQLENLAEKRGLALDALVQKHPELLDLVVEICGENFPRDKEEASVSKPGKLGEKPSA